MGVSILSDGMGKPFSAHPAAATDLKCAADYATSDNILSIMNYDGVLSNKYLTL